MKLIHTADLHLDSPMTTHFSPEKAKLRRDELRVNFRRLVEAAESFGVSCLLISGDLFDEKTPTKRSRKYVLEVIAAHPNLSFFYLAGNHDGKEALEEVAKIPDNLFLFGEGWTTCEPAPGLTITGSTSPDPDALAPLPKDSCNILMLHGQVLGGSGKKDADEIYPERYKGKNLDYLALGHLHGYSYQTLDARTAYCYSGCLEGRGFDECGEKGYVLLEWKNRKLEHSFVPFAGRTIHLVECDVSDVSSSLELEERISASVSEIPSKDIVRLRLCGSYLPDALPYLSADHQSLLDRFFYAESENKARLKIRREDYETDVSLKGEFVRTVLGDSTLTPEFAEQIILCGLRALTGEEPIV